MHWLADVDPMALSTPVQTPLASMNAHPSTEEFKATLAEREEKIRESWVRTMEARIVREELQKCYKAEGVNSYQVCHDLAQRYSELLKTAKVQGFRVIDV